MKNSQFNTVIHAPIRLQICSLLAPLEEAKFRILREELDVSDSVLCKHVKQLEEAGYVKQSKRKEVDRQQTWVRLTSEGRKAFKAHVETLKQLVDLAGV
jgi:DNA-binding MarR family transcriptional regulator